MYIGFAGFLALRTRNGRLKNYFNSWGTLPTHPVGPKKWTYIYMRGLLKWPNTSLVTVHCILVYLKFARHKTGVTLHLEDRKQFSRCMHLLGSCFNVLVSMLRKLGGPRDLVILETIMFLSSN